MVLHNFEQGSQEWLDARKECILTASEFGAFLWNNTKAAKEARFNACADYLTRNARLTDPWLAEEDARKEARMANTLSVQCGKEREPYAREAFMKETGLTVDQVGFITTDCGAFGCSPDGLIGDDSGLEIKCPMEMRVHLRYRLHEVLPSDYVCQVHGSMAVTGRSSWWFYSWYPGLPQFKLKVEADDTTKKIKDGLDALREECSAMHATIAGLYV